jgi:elongation factor 1-alpha
MDWYKGFKVKVKKEKVTGHTLYDALEKVVRPPKRTMDKPFRMPCSGVYKIKGVGDVITGRIEQGGLSPGTFVKFCPTGCIGKAFSIEMHHKSVPEAGPGDNVGVSTKALPKDNMPRTGDVMYKKSEEGKDIEPKPVSQFNALVFVQDHPGQLKAAIPDKKTGGFKGGFTPNCHVRTAKAPCCMINIAWKMGKETNNQKVEGAAYIVAGDQAEVTFKPKMPFCVESYDTCKPLGRIACMDSNSLIILGKVTKVTKKEYKV